MTQFKDLSVGQEFDFIGGGFWTSFFDRCVKISERKYTSVDRPERFPNGMEVGTISVTVYNVERETDAAE